MKTLAILGASGHGKVAADAAIQAGWDEVVFFDDSPRGGKSIGPWRILGATADLIRDRAAFDAAVIGIGDNRKRLQKHAELERGGVRLASVVHPRAVVSPHAEIGAGTVILAGAVVNAFAQLGRSCIVNTCASVDHDCLLADGVHVSPGAHLGGAVRCEREAWIGLGASVKQGVTIGPGAVVGAGAVVLDDVEGALTVVGVPARPVGC